MMMVAEKNAVEGFLGPWPVLAGIVNITPDFFLMAGNF